MTVLDRIEHHVGKFLAVLIAEDGQFQHIGSGPTRTQLHPQPLAELVMLAPQRQPILQQLLGNLGLHQVLNLCGAFTHRLRGRGPSGRRCQGRIATRTADECLRCAVRRFDQTHLALQTSQGKHAVLA